MYGGEEEDGDSDGDGDGDGEFGSVMSLATGLKSSRPSMGFGHTLFRNAYVIRLTLITRAFSYNKIGY